MENTIDLKGFDLILDYGTCFFDIYPISKFSENNELFEALNKIEEQTGKKAEIFIVNEDSQTIHIYIEK
jgi:hypothetical protein